MGRLRAVRQPAGNRTADLFLRRPRVLATVALRQELSTEFGKLKRNA
jgi:hypothetical protein